MATNSQTFVQADLASGTIHRILGTRVLDGEVFTLALCSNGEVWAYTPMHLAHLTGEIARQVA